MPPLSRADLIKRLHYTFTTGDYSDIDELVSGLLRKDNFASVCDEFFQGCRIDSEGYIVPSGFFHDNRGSASIIYAMYEMLGASPETFLLKHRVTRIKFNRKHLSGNFRLPRRMFSLPRLEALFVPGIGISRLPDECGQCKSLRILDLGLNRFTEFPTPVLKLSHLTALNLSGNMLISVPEELGRMSNLKILVLRGNKLKRLPGDWHWMQNLRTLDVSMNQISSVPDSLRTLVSLSDLRLAYNDLAASEEAQWECRVRENGRVRSSQEIG